MKKLVIFALALFLISCSATSVQDSLPFLRPAAALACNGVLTFALDGQDRIDKANMIYGIANGVRTLAGGAVPSPASLESVIAMWAPDKTHWAALATSLASIYGGAYAQIKGDPKLAVQFLEQIAQGCEDAAGAAIGK